MFAEFSTSSIPIRIPIAFRRVTTVKSPSANSTPERTTKCWSESPFTREPRFGIRHGAGGRRRGSPAHALAHPRAAAPPPTALREIAGNPLRRPPAPARATKPDSPFHFLSGHHDGPDERREQYDRGDLERQHVTREERVPDTVRRRRRHSW